MAETTRLTLAGRLTEATATIQRTLGHMPIVDVSEAGSGSAAEPIEAEFRVLLKTRKRGKDRQIWAHPVGYPPNLRTGKGRKHLGRSHLGGIVQAGTVDSW